MVDLETVDVILENTVQEQIELVTEIPAVVEDKELLESVSAAMLM